VNNIPTNTRESGLETLIVNWLTSRNGYEQGETQTTTDEYIVDESRLFRFLETTQPEQIEKLGLCGNNLKRMTQPEKLGIQKGKLVYKKRVCPLGLVKLLPSLHL